MTLAGTPSIALWQHGVALLLVAADIVSRAARSSALLPIGLSRSIIVNCCGDALAAVTPARVGGEPVRFIGFTRSGPSGPAVLASFATETVVNGLTLAGGAVLLFVFFADTAWRLTKHFVERASTGSKMPITLGAVALCAFVLLIAVRRVPGLGTRVAAYAAASWRRFRAQPRSMVAWAGFYTVVSMLARMAILPVLLAGMPGISFGSLMLGSAAALYALLLVPTPGGAGVIEAGFFAGFGDTMDAGDVATLIIAWRAYTTLFGIALGVFLLVRERSMRGKAAPQK